MFPGCKNGDVRLMDGNQPSTMDGRVELCISNTYGTVCNDRWDKLDAGVVCRQLGYNASSKFFAMNMLIIIRFLIIVLFLVSIPVVANYSGMEDGSSFATNIICNGTEASLLECPGDPIADHTLYECSRHRLAGVACNG